MMAPQAGSSTCGASVFGEIDFSLIRRHHGDYLSKEIVRNRADSESNVESLDGEPVAW